MTQKTVRDGELAVKSGQVSLLRGLVHCVMEYCSIFRVGSYGFVICGLVLFALVFGIIGPNEHKLWFFALVGFAIFVFAALVVLDLRKPIVKSRSEIDDIAKHVAEDIEMIRRQRNASNRKRS